ncbi:MAG TPA: ParB N-terminal domain-containing protein [Tepidisphaeraceae bacterium]|jgi:ParB-like chromosome segregation protein Spo0J|nr:ParB N-terminal domain-containing protein [Tepidisphaeraceae bacterium]
MTIETLPIDQVHADPANARRHPQRNLDAIMNSLARFGQQKPIVIDERNICRAGNGTLAAAKALGWKTINIVRTQLAGTEATAFGIADNRTAELAEWDTDVLKQFLADPNIGDLSFTPDELKALGAVEENLPDTDPAPIDLADGYQVVVDCDDEEEQREVYERLKSEGYTCRLMVL